MPLDPRAWRGGAEAAAGQHRGSSRAAAGQQQSSSRAAAGQQQGQQQGQHRGISRAAAGQQQGRGAASAYLNASSAGTTTRSKVDLYAPPPLPAGRQPRARRRGCGSKQPRQRRGRLGAPGPPFPMAAPPPPPGSPTPARTWWQRQRQPPPPGSPTPARTGWQRHVDVVALARAPAPLLHLACSQRQCKPPGLHNRAPTPPPLKSQPWATPPLPPPQPS